MTATTGPTAHPGVGCRVGQGEASSETIRGAGRFLSNLRVAYALELIEPGRAGRWLAGLRRSGTRVTPLKGGDRPAAGSRLGQIRCGVARGSSAGLGVALVVCGLGIVPWWGPGLRRGVAGGPAGGLPGCEFTG